MPTRWQRFVAILRAYWVQTEPSTQWSIRLLPARAFVIWGALYGLLGGTWADRRVLAALVLVVAGGVDLVLTFCIGLGYALTQRIRVRLHPDDDEPHGAVLCAECAADDVVPQPPPLDDGPGDVDPGHARAWERYARVLEVAILGSPERRAPHRRATRSGRSRRDSRARAIAAAGPRAHGASTRHVSAGVSSSAGGRARAELGRCVEAR
jgi:hypothetical protein